MQQAFTEKTLTTIHTLRDIGPHRRTGQPVLSVPHQVLAQGGSIADEGSVVSILQQVDHIADRGEAAAKLGQSLGDGVHQGVHCNIMGVNNRHEPKQLNWGLNANNECPITR